MKVKELIFMLETMEGVDEFEVVMPDFAPIVDVISSDYGDGCVILTDVAREENTEVDVDELMHEQQERDADFAEWYADNMSYLI